MDTEVDRRADQTRQRTAWWRRTAVRSPVRAYRCCVDGGGRRLIICAGDCIYLWEVVYRREKLNDCMDGCLAGNGVRV